MYTVEALLEDALRQGDEDAARGIARVIEKGRQRPAIIVTADYGKRRYVVAQEDEYLFNGIPNGSFDPQGHPHGWWVFGAQWLRGYGRVDEMYRTLSSSDVSKVERVDRKRVWGDA